MFDVQFWDVYRVVDCGSAIIHAIDAGLARYWPDFNEIIETMPENESCPIFDVSSSNVEVVENNVL